MVLNLPIADVKKQIYISVRFLVVTVVTMNIVVFWNATSCSLVDLYQRLSWNKGSRFLQIFVNDLQDYTESRPSWESPSLSAFSFHSKKQHQADSTERLIVGWLVNNNLERIWKETVGSSSGFAHRDWQKPSETSVNMAGVSTEIWTHHLTTTPSYSVDRRSRDR